MKAGGNGSGSVWQLESGTVLEKRRFTRAPHVLQAEQAGAVVLFDGRKYFTLSNETAVKLWSLLIEPRSVEELADRMHQWYDAPREVIARDVAAQLQLLSRERLVIEAGAGATPGRTARQWWQRWGKRT
jgi:hypothetical protein